MEFAQRLEQAKANLGLLPTLDASPHPTPQRRQMVDYLFSEIETLLLKNYSYEQIAQCLKEQLEVGISPGTLRKYHGDNRRGRKTSPSAPRQRQPCSEKPRKSPRSRPAQIAPIQASTQGRAHYSTASGVKPEPSPEPEPTNPVAPVDPAPEPVTQAAASPNAGEGPVNAAQPNPETQPENQPENQPNQTPVASPGATAREPEDDWGGDWNKDDDDSYTSGLLNEPTFNRIRHR